MANSILLQSRRSQLLPVPPRAAQIEIVMPRTASNVKCEFTRPKQQVSRTVDVRLSVAAGSRGRRIRSFGKRDANLNSSREPKFREEQLLSWREPSPPQGRTGGPESDASK
jgi:hypothetical protein